LFNTADDYSIHSVTLQFKRDIKRLHFMVSKISSESISSSVDSTQSLTVVFRSIGALDAVEADVHKLGSDEHVNQTVDAYDLFSKSSEVVIDDFEDSGNDFDTETSKLKNRRSISGSFPQELKSDYDGYGPRKTSVTFRKSSEPLGSRESIKSNEPIHPPQSCVYIFGYHIVPVDRNNCSITSLSQFSTDLNRLEIDSSFCKRLKQLLEESDSSDNLENMQRTEVSKRSKIVGFYLTIGQLDWHGYWHHTINCKLFAEERSAPICKYGQRY
jgi:hypothetical protein